MSSIPTRSGHLVWATMLLTGIFMVASPGHALAVLRIMAVSMAAIAGIHAVFALAPTGSATGRSASPFDRPARPADGRDSEGELRWLRRQFEGRRQPLEDGASLPAETIRLLQGLIAADLDRRGLNPEQVRRSATGLSPMAFEILNADPTARAPWFQTDPGRPETVAFVVNSVLDELGFNGREAAGSPQRGTHS